MIILNVSSHVGLKSSTTTDDLNSFCVPDRRIVTNGSEVPNAEAFFSFFPRTRVSSRMANGSDLVTPGRSALGSSLLTAMGTLTYLGHTSALARLFPMISVTVSFTPGSMSMSPPINLSWNFTDGCSTNATFIR